MLNRNFCKPKYILRNTISAKQIAVVNLDKTDRFYQAVVNLDKTDRFYQARAVG
jgi:hypothetical protein